MTATPLPRPRVIGPPPHSPAAEHALIPPHALVEDLKNADRPGIRAELGIPETVIPELLRESAAILAVALAVWREWLEEHPAVRQEDAP